MEMNAKEKQDRQAHARGGIESALRHELIGPDPLRPEWRDHHHDEILGPQDGPKQRFSAGVLFPQKSIVETEDADDEETTEDAMPSDAPAEDEVGDNGDSEFQDAQAFRNEAGERPPTDIDELKEHNPNEHEVNRANEYLPSAMGLTCRIQVPKSLRIVVKAARYETVKKLGLGEPDKKTGQPKPHHLRYAIEHTIELDGSLLLASQRLVLDPSAHAFLRVKDGEHELQLGLHIFSRTLHGRAEGNQRLVTFTLINRNECSGEDGRAKNEDCFFQCSFTVSAADETECILDYPERAAKDEAMAGDKSEEASEERMLDLLYRDRRAFAIGHGCAADWPPTAGDAVQHVRTEIIPRFEVFPLKFDVPGIELSMGRLAEMDETASLAMCTDLANAYERWIQTKESEIASSEFPAKHQNAAQIQIKKCRECLRRVRDGIEALRTSKDAMLVFRWMNEAMQLQGVHYDRAKKPRKMVYSKAEPEAAQVSPTGRRVTRRRTGQYAAAPEPESSFVPPSPSELSGRRWRPFQLAFVLMNVRGLIEPGSPDRELVDLIWFPTGGGKTEAYLGLTAMTIFWRRLRNPADGGTTVLMRYTLRLLTTQQFQRAASLICACELRRLAEPRLQGPGSGSEPISIGLWVGNSVTPNKRSAATAALAKLAREGKPNPFVLLACPWCGCELGPVQQPSRWDPNGERQARAFDVPGYRREEIDGDNRVIFCCPDTACRFHSEAQLPVYVVDEDIYEQRPTLVIGTVDKFAMMPWQPDAMKLFGLGRAVRSVPPPSLIIQDELHLIAGALGSMVGHYELTIDALTEHEGVPAKIIASTATICRAADQVRKLYNREVAIFPPQGLLASDSFFAQEDRDTPGRVYLGVMCTAVGSHISAQVNTLASLMQTPATLGRDGAVADVLDPYWTMMVYFNSLRELGHATTLLRADIQERLFYLWKRLGITKSKTEGVLDPRRFVRTDKELTSRITGDEVAAALKELFEPCKDAPKPSGARDHDAIDVCLATNMIQVGLDVSRLGLMAVIGQPKGTSEYIQATSRVGRGNPGLVVTIYNPAKPRDRSHYEHFKSYHQSLYRWVEPTSVTPFALPVRERGLHAQVITLARYWGGLFGQNNLREHANHPPSGDLLSEIESVIIERCRAVDDEEVAGVERKLGEIMTKWMRSSPGDYGNFRLNDDPRLMYPMGSPPRAAWEFTAMKTPTSMRSVDATCDATVAGQFQPMPTLP